MINRITIMASYYIMQKGQLMGPADDTRVKSMLSRGLILDEATVSQDRLNWVPVRSLLENDSQPEADLRIVAPPRTAAKRNSLLVLAWVLILMIILMLSAGAAILVYTGTLQRWLSTEQVEDDEQETPAVESSEDETPPEAQ